MNPMVKRIVLVGVALAAAVAVLGSMGGIPFLRPGLPPANPAARAPAQATQTTQPTPAPSGQTQRLEEMQRRLVENSQDTEALAYLSDYLFQSKQYGQAADLLFQALEEGPDVPRLRMVLGLALFYQGMPSMAQRELKRVIEADPNNVEAHFNYALMMSHGPKSDMKAAQASWEKVAQLDKDGELGRKAREFLGQTAASSGTQAGASGR